MLFAIYGLIIDYTVFCIIYYYCYYYQSYEQFIFELARVQEFSAVYERWNSRNFSDTREKYLELLVQT